MKTVNFTLMIIGAFIIPMALTTGCNNGEESRSATLAEPQQQQEPEPVELFGLTWHYYGPYKSKNPIMPWPGVEYRADDSHRLITQRGDGSEPYSVTLVAWTEKLVGANWVKDGTEIVEFYDGMRRQTEFRNGKMHGIFKQWHPNGQLATEQEYVDDQLHGRYRRWDAQGQLECEVYHSFGVEVPEADQK